MNLDICSILMITAPLLIALVPLFALQGQSLPIRIIKYSEAVPFSMGKVDSRRIIHPEMGARGLTLNYSVSEPGHEFPQHIHDKSDDTFLVLEGQVNVRQGQYLTPLLAGQAAFVPSGQIHGTITSGDSTAILISFQVPPDLDLYTGSRDSSRQGACPPTGVITPGAVRIIDFQRGNDRFLEKGMSSKGVSASFSNLAPGSSYSFTLEEGFESFLFVWQGLLKLEGGGHSFHANELDTVFVNDKIHMQVTAPGPNDTQFIEVKAPTGAD